MTMAFIPRLHLPAKLLFSSIVCTSQQRRLIGWSTQSNFWPVWRGIHLYYMRS